MLTMVTIINVNMTSSFNFFHNDYDDENDNDCG